MSSFSLLIIVLASVFIVIGFVVFWLFMFSGTSRNLDSKSRSSSAEILPDAEVWDRIKKNLQDVANKNKE